MSSNLSELSIQLRKLQSEKTAQSNEIDRLERQIRILSELKGISISDLQLALKQACEAEAHGELRSIVGKLQARVDGLQLGGGGVGGHRNVKRGQDQFNEEAAARARTALQLRIGELEEVEAKLRAELNGLYKQIQGLTERNTFLETKVLQQKAMLDQWELRWNAKMEEETRRSSVVPMQMPSQSTGAYNYAEFATTGNASASPPVLLHNAPQSQVDAEHQQRLLAAETALAGEKQQRSLVQTQLDSAQKTHELKKEQYEHRIQFLEEQLHDLEQQLNSLYAAFGMMQDDNKVERTEKEAWKRTLLESDAALAKEQEEREERNQQNRQQQQQFSTHGNGTNSTPQTEKSSRRSLTNILHPPPASLPRAAVRPAAHAPIAKGYLLLLLDKEDQPLQPNNAQSTPQQRKSFSARKLLSKTPSNRRHPASSAASHKFKKQFCVLHGANGLYQIRYGDSYTGPVAGVHEFITAEVSSIEVSCSSDLSNGLVFATCMQSH